MQRDALARLRDFVMQLRESLAARDLVQLKELFASVENVNIKGRFLKRDAFLARFEELNSRIDEPSLELVRVEEIEVEGSSAFGTYLVDLSWIDRESWEEVLTSALMSLDMQRKTRAWVLKGFTFCELPRGAGVSRGERDPSRPSGMTSVLADLDSTEGTGFYSFVGYGA